jgi:hypothetical protein
MIRLEKTGSKRVGFPNLTLHVDQSLFHFSAGANEGSWTGIKEIYCEFRVRPK